MKNCCVNASGFLKVAVVVVILALVLHLIGFAVPFWSVRLNSNEGLWEVCGAGTCVVSSVDPIGSQDWYRATQAFAILSFIFAAVTIVLLFVAVCVPCLSRCKPLLVSALVISFVTAIWIIIALTIYGVRGKVFLEGQFGSAFVVGFGFILFAISLFGYLFVALFVGMAINQIVSEELEEKEKKEAEKSDDVEKGKGKNRPEETPEPAKATERDETPPVVKPEPPDTAEKWINELPKEMSESRNEGPRNEEPRHEELMKPKPRREEPRNEELMKPKPRNEEPRNEEPMKPKPRMEEPRNEEAWKPKPRNEEPRNEEPMKPKPRNEEPRHEEPWKPKPRNEEPRNEENMKPKPINPELINPNL